MFPALRVKRARSALSAGARKGSADPLIEVRVGTVVSKFKKRPCLAKGTFVVLKGTLVTVTLMVLKDLPLF